MSKDNRNYSVYIHTFPNGKVYVGITCENPERRWRADGSGYRKQRVMRFAIAKYGWQNVTHKIVADNLTKKEACDMEMELIARYKSNQHDFGYNVDNGGQTSGSHSQETIEKIRSSQLGEKNHNFGREFSQETRDKLSLAHKGKKLGSENIASKTVICVETNEIFPTIKDAAEAKGMNRSTISNYLRGLSKGGGGYHWEYYNLSTR